MLKDYFNSLVLIHEKIKIDAFGTHTEAYEAIQTFSGAITTIISGGGMRGEQPHPLTKYQLTTTKEIPLKFNDIIKDNDKYYQIINDSVQTPKSAQLNIRQFEVKKININMI